MVTEATIQEMTTTRALASSRTEGDLGRKNQKVRNTKPDHLVSSKTLETSGQQCKQWVRKSRSFVDGAGGSQNHAWPRGETSGNG
jgi:hypothetical protein